MRRTPAEISRQSEKMLAAPRPARSGRPALGTIYQKIIHLFASLELGYQPTGLFTPTRPRFRRVRRVLKLGKHRGIFPTGPARIALQNRPFYRRFARNRDFIRNRS